MYRYAFTVTLVFILSFLFSATATALVVHELADSLSTSALAPGVEQPELRFSPTPQTRLIKVTSLADSGPGTLRECASSPGSRVCIFEVGGVIPLRSPIRIQEPDILIAGETAPDPGITTIGAGLKIETRNVHVRHLAIRPGDSPIGAKPSERDGISIGTPPPNRAHRVTLDHVSLTWAIDENLSTWYPGTADIVVANSIIAEGLHDSIHPKGPHSKGVLIGTDTQRVALRGNLIAFNEERNPYIQPGTSVQIINNVIYGWGSRSASSACNLTNNDDSDVPVRAALVGNVFVPGPTSFTGSAPIYAKKIASMSHIFVRDNLGPHRSSSSDDQSQIVSFPRSLQLSPECPFRTGCASPLAAVATEAVVLSRAGSRPARRSPIDERLVNEVRSRTGDLKDCTVGCARSTGGVRLSRPTRRLLTPPSRPLYDDDSDGVSNLSEWLTRFQRDVENMPS